MTLGTLFSELGVAIIEPIDAGFLDTEREGVAVYRRKVQYFYPETGQRVTQKKVHHVGHCESCLIGSGVLTPSGVNAAIADAKRECPQLCGREQCALKAR